MLQAERRDGPRRVIREDVADPSLLGAGEHGPAIVAEQHRVGQLGLRLPAAQGQPRGCGSSPSGDAGSLGTHPVRTDYRRFEVRSASTSLIFSAKLSTLKGFAMKGRPEGTISEVG